MTRIYALCHPKTGRIRYIGKCVTALSTRRNNHMYKARSGRQKTPLAQWLLALSAGGLLPEIRELAVVTKGTWQQAERSSIQQYRDQGYRLFNKHAGGNGAHTRAKLADELIPLLGQISDARIAEKAGLCRETITYHRRKLQIPRAHDYTRMTTVFKKNHTINPCTDLPAAVIAQLGRRSDMALARELGLDKGVLRRARRARGIEPAPDRRQIAVPRGEAHSRAKLTVAQVQELRRRYVSGSRTHGSGALAREYGLDLSTVWSIVTYRAWAHVKETV